MTDFHDDFDEEETPAALSDDLVEEDKDDEEESGEGEAGAATQGVANVSDNFFALMVARGASKELIAEVLKNWRHLKGEGLMRRLSDFVRNLVTSKHVEVEIDKRKNFNVVHDFIQETKNINEAHAAKPGQHNHLTNQNIPKPL